ncbi:hypothetical protein [Aureimonas sp. AU22]|uniref:hypothetical protein n=1 Tax=Aureimonas sp. AU22 TaxID=1638162 RepID=UPI000B21563B|nr:hypothetical protein [Aureimonas sp. AU22]
MVGQRNSMNMSGRSLDIHPGGMTELEAELLEFERTHGNTYQSRESDAGFIVLGLSALLMNAAFGWVIFKKVWFGWLAMPGWW